MRLACADGRGLTSLLLGPLKASQSLLWEATSPPPTDPTCQPHSPIESRRAPSIPAKSAFLPDCVMFVFHHGCRDLESSRRDATLALILAATNRTVQRELRHEAAQGLEQMQPTHHSWGAPKGCTGGGAQGAPRPGAPQPGECCPGPLQGLVQSLEGGWGAPAG